MNTKIISATTVGIDAFLVDVEVDLSLGMLQFFIVGLPDTAIKESKQRIVTALKNCGIKLPERKITVNLAPADLKKEGTLFDLPIALGILHAAQLCSTPDAFLQETIFIGELSLDGSIKPAHGVLSIAYDAARSGKKRLIVPLENAQEAALIKNIEIVGVAHLTTLIGYLRQEISLEPTVSTFDLCVSERRKYAVDFGQVKGQYAAKRALQIAAAGRHNVLFIGSPGCGKSMLAQRLPTVMPPMSFDEIIETTKIYSISGKLGQDMLAVHRPFRSPHHTISQAGLVGGGSNPRPGEISLSHNGILFLDELTEFKKSLLESLRQPLETKTVSIARAQQTITFPASFLLVAALNPCPCGYLGDKRIKCTCSPDAVARYINKLSGPFLDRMDIQVNVASVDYDTIAQNTTHASSETLYAAVEKAVARQKERFAHLPIGDRWNAFMASDLIDSYCILSEKARDIVKKAFDRLHLSMRGYHKVLKVARTIADLEENERIEETHMHEALSYRSLDYNKERT